MFNKCWLISKYVLVLCAEDPHLTLQTNIKNTFFPLVLKIESRASYRLAAHSTTEQYPQLPRISKCINTAQKCAQYLIPCSP
jgi:hypothetical protein